MEEVIKLTKVSEQQVSNEQKRFTYIRLLENKLQKLNTLYSDKQLNLTINIYELSKQHRWMRYFCIGIYHSSIQINGEYEIAYGGGDIDDTGVYIEKSSVENKIYKQYPLKCDKNISQLNDIVLQLAPIWRTKQYKFTRQNCNDFTDLLVHTFSNNNQTLPKWVNNASRLYNCLVKCFSCLCCCKKQKFDPLNQTTMTQTDNEEQQLINK